MTIRRAATKQRREKLRDLTRHEILTAAARVFARCGFESATMHDIAAAAGFSTASLYTYFRSKEAIYGALIELASTAMDAPLDEGVDRERPFAQRLEALLARQLDVMAQHLDIMMLMLQPTASTGSAAIQQQLRESGMPRTLARFERWLKLHSTAKERGHVPPRRLALAVMGVGQVFAMDRLMQSSPAGFDGLAREVVDQVLYGTVGKPS